MGEEQALGMTCTFLAQGTRCDGIHETGKLKGILFVCMFQGGMLKNYVTFEQTQFEVNWRNLRRLLRSFIHTSNQSL